MTAYDLIRAERDRQENLYATGVLPQIASRPDCPDVLRLAALVEEVGEVGRALLDSEQEYASDSCRDDELQDELIQVAAIAVAWLEAIA